VTADRRRRWRLLPAVTAVLVQLSVLYSPSGGGGIPAFPNFDKLVHCSVFAVPVLLALLAGLPKWPVVMVFALHAPVSELIQWTLLPRRSGDPWDVLADLVGVALGAAAGHLVTRHRRSPTAGGGLRSGSRATHRW